MTRRRIEWEHPHQVAIPSPAGGHGARLMEMHAFCRGARARYYTKVDRREGGNFTRFCFDDPVDADAFAAQFGGERITIMARGDCRAG